ncbi:GNAT family N-acetyltransferase [Streptomyces sp. A7024]|uniref:GNAT family N-acetyltransferase n=1 Tax=Streptomyces coryli TaxID=1128680 RepID=A0A6G4UCR3_9ACTN|nr:GNAT family N-acetyltransferase [Streptomyces coryli]NGN70009.1 GNAT family N-acetyltransferase [Streptomyces coryli]
MSIEIHEVSRPDDDVLRAIQRLLPQPLATGLRARIEDVVVDEAARDQDVGAELTRAAVQVAGAAGARSVDLTSRPGREAANRLYGRLGFEARESVVYRYVPEGE